MTALHARHVENPESAPICDVCLTALDGLYRHRPINCDNDCPLHEACARCGGTTNGRRVLVDGVVYATIYSRAEPA